MPVLHRRPVRARIVVARRRGTVYACPDEIRHRRLERPAEPIRTCVGCRTRAAASGLLRVVAVDETLVPDPRRRQPGRGVWIHPDIGCLRLAERRRAFPRALRRAGALDTAAVHAYLTQLPGDAIGPRLAVDPPESRGHPGARTTERAGRSDMYPQP
ncbi:MAG TPA: YlxR family protein [Pseudonocardiaceae bacterium]|nr:YlxR family protein [Pseudonocardiaceae bacterium]